MLVTRHRRAAIQNEDRVAVLTEMFEKESRYNGDLPTLLLALYVAVAAIAHSYAGLSDVALKAQRCVKAQCDTSAA